MAQKKLLIGKDVIDFWKYMESQYRFIVVEKADSKAMEKISWVLDAMGILDHKEFMANFTTTLGRVVYVPFDIGVGNQRQLLSQVETCVHEAEHVVQYMRNRAKFVWKYVTSDASRSHYESEAYLTNMEMHFYLTGKLLGAKSLSGLLESYGVGEDDIRVTYKQLTIASKLVKRGAVISNTSKTAIKYLKAKGF